MPPQLALLGSLTLSFVLLWRERKLHQDVSAAAWIPCLWLLILGSRSVSQWLNLSTPYDADFLMDGSPADRLVYALLMVSAVVVLWWRRLSWTRVITANPWLTLFFVYCALSVLWSDFPGVAFKRWLKSLGDPLIVLVLLSEAKPAVAIASVLRRCAFLLIPLSIVFIKYFPYLGRSHDVWSGMQFYTGVTTNKNLLGYLLLVFGLYFVSVLLTKDDRSADEPRPVSRIPERAVAGLFLVMIAYLFRMANSMTPLLALIVAAGVVFMIGLPTIRRYFGVCASFAIVGVAFLQLLFGIAEVVVETAGRDTTLTGRPEIWSAVMAMTPSALIGAGFQSFWLGDRLDRMWDLFPVFRPNQAHNGYIELYINLGVIGLLLVLGILISGYRTVRERLSQAVDGPPGRYEDVVLAKVAIGYFAAFLLYNVTEAVINPLNFLFIIFLLLAMRSPSLEAPRLVHSSLPVFAKKPSRQPFAATARMRDGRTTAVGRAGRVDSSTRPAAAATTAVDSAVRADRPHNPNAGYRFRRPVTHPHAARGRFSRSAR